MFILYMLCDSIVAIYPFYPGMVLVCQFNCYEVKFKCRNMVGNIFRIILSIIFFGLCLFVNRHAKRAISSKFSKKNSVDAIAVFFLSH